MDESGRSFHHRRIGSLVWPRFVTGDKSSLERNGIVGDFIFCSAETVSLNGDVYCPTDWNERRLVSTIRYESRGIFRCCGQLELSSARHRYSKGLVSRANLRGGGVSETILDTPWKIRTESSTIATRVSRQCVQGVHLSRLHNGT
jgi:hypothetical protein